MNCSDTTTHQHPLIRNGATQAERFLNALNAKNLKLDPRSFQQWLNFAYEFSGSINFFNSHNIKDGDWKIFWEKEPTAMLAIAASIDVDSMESAYRGLELEYWRKKRMLALADKKQPILPTDLPEYVLTQLIEEIFKVPSLLLDLCNKIPYEQPLKSEIAQLVKSNLQKPMDDLISYHKASSTTDLYLTYLPFFGNDACQSAWGVDSDGFLLKEIDDSYNLEKLRRLYLQFRKVLLNIKTRAAKSLQQNLFTRKDHKPHLTLFLTFLYLFRYLQEDLNRLPERHLLYYYQDVLRMAYARSKPDMAYLLIGIAPNLPDGFLLPRDTKFVGGSDQSGKNRIYVTTENTVFNQAEIAALQSLTFLTTTNTEDCKTQIQAAIFLPDASKQDGLKLARSAEDPAWGGMYGLNAANWVYLKSLYELLKKGIIADADYPKDIIDFFIKYPSKKADSTSYFNNIYSNLSPIIPKFGLVIATPELWMERSSKRTITLNFGANLPTNFKNYVSFWLSTPEGLVKIEDEKHGIVPEKTSNPPIAIDDNSISNSISITLNSTFPPIVSFQTTNKPGEISISSPYPHLLIQLDDITRYESLKDFQFNQLSIKTSSIGVSPSIVQLGNSVIPLTAEIPKVSSTLYFSIPEASARKTLNELTVDKNSLITQASKPNPTPTPSQTPSITLTQAEAMKAPDTGVLEDLYLLKDYSDYKSKESIKPEDVHLPFSEITQLSKFEPGKTRGGFIKGKVIPGDVKAPEKFPASKILYSYGANEVFIIPSKSDSIVTEGQLFYTSPIRGSLELPLDGKSPINFFPKIEQPGFDSPADLAPVPITIEIPQIIGSAILDSTPTSSEKTEIGDSLERRKKTAKLVSPALQESKDIAGLDANQNVAVLNTKEIVSIPTAPIAFAHGNLLIGIKNIRAGQILSLLFQVAEGTGNSEAIAPKVVWSYWSETGWIQFPAHFILEDETLGMLKTGIVRFQMPEDISPNAWETQLYYIRASATEDKNCNQLLEVFPSLLGVHTQAVKVSFLNQGNTLEHLDQGLPAGSISQLRFRDANIKKIDQPYRSFGGQLPEKMAPERYQRRVSERLRHRNRAVTVWDYERLVLENHPAISVAKALPHTNIDDVTLPGCVTVAVIPFIKNVPPKNRFVPTVEAGVLEEIRLSLSKRNSFFVGGADKFEHCCCHEESHKDGEECGCGCGCSSSCLHVVNARFEPIRVSLCVRFRKGEDVNLAKRHLDAAIEKFLAPWALDQSKPLLFGSPIRTSQLLNFLEQQDYVDVITDFRFKHFKSLQDANTNEYTTSWEQPAVIEPFSPRGVLTTYQNQINANNSNVIDHDIKVFTDESCACINCIENDIRKQIINTFETIILQNNLKGPITENQILTIYSGLTSKFESLRLAGLLTVNPLQPYLFKPITSMTPGGELTGLTINLSLRQLPNPIVIDLTKSFQKIPKNSI